MNTPDSSRLLLYPEKGGSESEEMLYLLDSRWESGLWEYNKGRLRPVVYRGLRLNKSTVLVLERRYLDILDNQLHTITLVTGEELTLTTGSILWSTHGPVEVQSLEPYKHGLLKVSQKKPDSESRFCNECGGYTNAYTPIRGYLGTEDEDLFILCIDCHSRVFGTDKTRQTREGHTLQSWARGKRDFDFSTVRSVDTRHLAVTWSTKLYSVTTDTPDPIFLNRIAVYPSQVTFGDLMDQWSRWGTELTHRRETR